MSVIYLVTPFSTLGKKDLADMRTFLAQNGLDYPPQADQSRYPTQSEIEKVLRSFTTHEVEFHPPAVVGTELPWQYASLFKRAQPSSSHTFAEYAELVAPKEIADKDSPCEFYLSRGDEHLNYAILDRLAHGCGPLLCVTEGECDAVIFHRRVFASNPPPSFASDHHLRHEGA